MKKFKVTVSYNGEEKDINVNANGKQAAIDSATKRFKSKNKTTDVKVVAVTQIVDDMDV